mgnify:CR=1 FL=1
MKTIRYILVQHYIDISTMDPMLLFLKRYVLSLLFLNLAACSSMQPVNIEHAMKSDKARGIDYGSLVEVKTLDRKTIKFRVTDITNEGLGGNRGFYRYEDMKSLREEQPHSNQTDTTLAWELGAQGNAALIALHAQADSVTVCRTPP